MIRSEFSGLRDQRSRLSAFLGGIGAVLALASGAQAETDYSVIKDKKGNCSVVFEPTERTSKSSPQFMATYAKSGKRGLVSIGVARPDDWNLLQLVHRNQRQTFESIDKVRPKDLEDEPLWMSLGKNPEKPVLFNLTGRDADEEFHSSSYRALSKSEVATALVDECDAKGGPFKPSEIGSLEEEKALGLKPREIRHIRWVLNQKYSDAVDVGRGDMTDGERDMLARYAAERQMEPSRYLNADLAARLKAEEFKPKRKNLRREPGFKRFEDWISYDDVDNRTCAIVSFAKRTKGFKTYTVPRMEIHADPSARGNSLFFDFVTPNRFNNDYPITATVDGRKIRLNIEDGRVRPVDLRNGFASSDIVRAIRRGKEIVIRGTGMNGKTKHVVRFSALGFTAAFNKMAYDCDRPRIREWLR